MENIYSVLITAVTILGGGGAWSRGGGWSGSGWGAYGGGASWAGDGGEASAGGDDAGRGGPPVPVRLELAEESISRAACGRGNWQDVNPVWA